MLLTRALNFSDSIAVKDESQQLTYTDLCQEAIRACHCLIDHPRFNKGSRVALLAQPGVEYAIELLAIWGAGGIAVPINPEHPIPSLAHVITDSGTSLLLTVRDLEPYGSLARELQLELLPGNKADIPLNDLPAVSGSDPALIIYTSGTTSLPKGVVLTHSNLEAQMDSLSQAWEWHSSDIVLNVLPLHHVHGIINVLCCAIWNGATCEFVSKFDQEKIRARFIAGGLTVFMAVPTIYFKLIEYWKTLNTTEQKAWTESMKSFRLMVSGSAALPEVVHQAWENISGQVLLERYGMSEAGMILSNPYNGQRRPGFVGYPLPGVSIKIMDAGGNPVAPTASGELWVKGMSVFTKYWEQPHATEESFEDGWFKTGDIVVLEQGYYRILGRKSVDIIKTGGYKVSALEVENVLLGHPMVKECAVVGVPNEQWGESVVACVVSREKDPNKEELIGLVERNLADYKKPKDILYMKTLPRNSLGKIVKSKLTHAIKNDLD